MNRQTTLPILLAAALLGALPAQAQATNPDRCRSYADAQVALATEADAKACPQIKARAKNWDSHFNWCLRQTQPVVDREAETWDARFDGCMSAIEAAKTERALADADRKARADAVVGSYAERWAKGLRRMGDLGMTRPHDPKGFEFQAVSTQARRWGAGWKQGQQLGFYAVCDSCKGITVRLLDAKGQVIDKAQGPGNAVQLIAYPPTSGAGSIEFTVTNCQTRDDSCKLRYTSFVL